MSFTIKVPKKLIEVAMPLDAINAAASAEKNNPFVKGHPRSIHTWWARQPLTGARAIIFGQLVNDPSWKWEISNPGEVPPNHLKASWARNRKRLFSIIEELVKWENTSNASVLKKARAEISNSWREVCEINRDHPDASSLFDPEELPPFHDPFSGGGSLPLEAQRLGLVAFATDLNPVPVIIGKAMIEVPPKWLGKPALSSHSTSLHLEDGHGLEGLAKDIRHYGNWMQTEAVERLRGFYPDVEITAEIAAQRPELRNLIGRVLPVGGWIWARTVKSPNPAFRAHHVPLATSFVLSNKAGKQAYVQPIIEGSSYRFEVVLGPPPPAAANGTKVGRGDFKCLLSDSAISIDYIRTQGLNGALGARLMALVVEGPRGKIYLSPDEASERAVTLVEPTWSPDIEINRNPRDIRTQLYGLTRYSDLFTKRQLLAMNTFCDLVHEVRDKIQKDISSVTDFGSAEDNQMYSDAIVTYLGIATSKWSDYSNTLCSWNSNNQNVRNTFARQAIAMSWDYVEVSPFSNLVPWESVVELICKSLRNLPADAPSGHAYQMDAAQQEVAKNTVISTDPPYYNNIFYADLADFFYVWMRRALLPIYPDVLSTVLTPKTDELVAHPVRAGGEREAEAFFLDGMTKAMTKLAQQAHPAFPVTIYYAFKQSETTGDEGTTSTGWETFIGAVLRSGFSVHGTWPMRTNKQGRSTAIGANALASAIILVCHPRPAEAEVVSRRQFVRELNSRLPEALDEMTRGSGSEASPVAPVDLSQAIIGPGLAIFSKYAAVLEADGSPMTVKNALRLINRFLTEDDFDPETQFCLHWFEQHGWSDGPFGEADQLARAKGTAVQGVQDAGVLSSHGGLVRLKKWSEYPADWDCLSDNRVPVWEVLHQAIRLVRIEGEAAAGTLLAAVQSTSEATRQLAYRLYTLCERAGWADDARAYNEIITSWSAIEAAAASAAGPRQAALFET